MANHKNSVVWAKTKDGVPQNLRQVMLENATPMAHIFCKWRLQLKNSRSPGCFSEELAVRVLFPRMAQFFVQVRALTHIRRNGKTGSVGRACADTQIIIIFPKRLGWQSAGPMNATPRWTGNDTVNWCWISRPLLKKNSVHARFGMTMEPASTEVEYVSIKPNLLN